MPLSQRIRDLGFTEALDKLSNLSSKDFAPEFRFLGQDFAARIRSNWDQGVDPYGNPWQPLSKRYLRSKAKKQSRFPTSILKQTGEARNNVRFRVLKDGITLYVTRNFADGTDITLHQEGGRHPVTGWEIPARPILPFEGMPDEWGQVANEVLSDALTRRIFK